MKERKQYKNGIGGVVNDKGRKGGSGMNLSEAIEHLNDVLSDEKEWECEECRNEHVELREFLKELEQYRAIGTVEEIRKVVQFLSLDNENGIIEDMEELNKYKAIGTVSECREAMQKQRAKKPDSTGYDEQDYFKCPSCGGELAILDDYFPKQPYCADCGQALDWSS